MVYIRYTRMRQWEYEALDVCRNTFKTVMLGLLRGCKVRRSQPPYVKGKVI